MQVLNSIETYTLTGHVCKELKKITYKQENIASSNEVCILQIITLRGTQELE
jgi:hypothetical protein